MNISKPFVLAVIPILACSLQSAIAADSLKSKVNLPMPFQSNTLAVGLLDLSGSNSVNQSLQSSIMASLVAMTVGKNQPGNLAVAMGFDHTIQRIHRFSSSSDARMVALRHRDLFRSTLGGTDFNFAFREASAAIDAILSQNPHIDSLYLAISTDGMHELSGDQVVELLSTLRFNHRLVQVDLVIVAFGQISQKEMGVMSQKLPMRGVQVQSRHISDAELIELRKLIPIRW